MIISHRTPKKGTIAQVILPASPGVPNRYMDKGILVDTIIFVFLVKRQSPTPWHVKLLKYDFPTLSE